MSLFSNGGHSYPDVLIVTLLAIFSLLSLVLNPLVMLYNYKKKNSIPKILFFILATTDFLTCLVMPLNSMIQIAAKEPPKCKEVPGKGYLCSIDFNPTIGQRFLGAMILTLAVSPSCFTAVLAITRFITIRFPFRTMKVRYSLLFVVLYITYTLAVNCVVTFDEYAIYRDTLSLVTNPFYINRTFSAPHNDIRVLMLCIWPLLLSQVLSIIASGFTVVHLFQRAKCTEDSPSQINGKKVSLKILVTNVSGIILTAAAGISAKIQIDNAEDRLPEKWDEVLEFTTMIMVPVFLSSLNPVIFISFTPNVLKQFIKRGRVGPGVLFIDQETSYQRSVCKAKETKLRDTTSSPI